MNPQTHQVMTESVFNVLYSIGAVSLCSSCQVEIRMSHMLLPSNSWRPCAHFRFTQKIAELEQNLGPHAMLQWDYRHRWLRGCWVRKLSYDYSASQNKITLQRNLQQYTRTIEREWKFRFILQTTNSKKTNLVLYIRCGGKYQSVSVTYLR